MRSRLAAAAVTGSLLAGGAIGATLFGPQGAGAQTQPDTTEQSSPRPHTGEHEGTHGGHIRGGFGMARNLATAAAAIGISEDDLRTSLQAGNSLAQAAEANGVAPQKVIDALVAEASAKLADAVASGKLTQAQADDRSAELTQKVTDRVNGVHPVRGDDGRPPRSRDRAGS